MSEQEQNGLEQVEHALLEGESFLERNLKSIIIAVVAILVVAGGWVAYNHLVKNPRNEKASAELFKAEEFFIQGQDSLALAGQGMSAKGVEAILSEYSGTDAGNLAYAYKGIALYEQGQYEEAIKALDAYKGSDAYVAPSLIRLKGDCLAQLAKYQEAANAYEQAARQADNEAISPSCLVKAGHAYEKLGNKAKALELYRKVQNDYLTTPEGSTIESEIARAEQAN